MAARLMRTPHRRPAASPANTRPPPLPAPRSALSLTFCIVTRDYMGNPFDVSRLSGETLRL